MHDHIKKLLDRCYVVKDANTRFSPTKLVMISSPDDIEKTDFFLNTLYMVARACVILLIE